MPTERQGAPLRKPKCVSVSKTPTVARSRGTRVAPNWLKRCVSVVAEMVSVETGKIAATAGLIACEAIRNARIAGAPRIAETICRTFENCLECPSDGAHGSCCIENYKRVQQPGCALCLWR